MITIEKRLEYYYLVCVFLWNREKVYIGKETKINLSNIEYLIDKQMKFIVKNKKYLNFEKELYNNHLLKKIVKKNLLITCILSFKKKDWKILLDKDLLKLYEKYSIYYGQEFVFDFVYNSNKIEWSKIPQDQIRKIIQKRLFNYSNKNEVREVINSQKVLLYMEKEFLFNERSIKRTYHILTDKLFQETWDKYPRWYKKIANVVWNTSTSSPDEVKKDITNLLKRYKSNKKIKFPLQLAFDFHFTFERIHPFQNGNWRVGRFLMNKILKANWFLPMIIREQNRERYFNVFSSAIDWNKKKYYKFLLEQYLFSLERI